MMLCTLFSVTTTKGRNMQNRMIFFSFAAVLFWFAADAKADDLGKPMFSLSGFGTAGVTYSDERQADFTSNFLKAKGAGFSRRWSADVDSRIGVQLTANFTPELSGVVQVISELRYDNTYLPIVEWANLKYQFTPDLSVRIGRIALPTFLAADYRKLGYALPWARTPGEVYSLVPITNSDGVDFSYRTRIGDWKNNFRAAFGKTDIKYNVGEAKARAIRGVSDTIEYGDASVRLSYVQADVTVNFAQALFDGFRQFGVQGNTLADRYNGSNKRFTVIGLGATYDPGDWFVTAELGKSRAHSFLGDKTAWYASGGYRIGKLTPYLAFAQVRADSNASDPGLNVAGMPPQLAGLATGLNAGLNGLIGLIGVQKSIAVGTRWDFKKDAAVKLQYDRIMLGTNSLGNLIGEQPGFRRGGTANVASVVLDFVF